MFSWCDGELTRLIGYEAAKSFELEKLLWILHLCQTKGHELSSTPIVVSIMRAGNGMLESLLNLMPTAKAGHWVYIGISVTNSTVEYYFRLPKTRR